MPNAANASFTSIISPSTPFPPDFEDTAAGNLGDVSVGYDEFADAEDNELKFPESPMTKSLSETSLFKRIDKKIDTLKDTVCSFFAKMTLNSKSPGAESTVMEESGAMTNDSPTEVKQDQNDENPTDLSMRACRSITHLETFFPFLQYQNNHFTCLLCQNFHGNPSGKSKKYSFFYDENSSIDFENLKILPREFRNLKMSLKRHITDSELHCEAAVSEKKRTKDAEIKQKNSVTAGLALGLLAYAILHRGRPLSDFTMDVLLSAKNGAFVGDINHSKRFIMDFRSHCSCIITTKIKRHLSMPLECTGRRPPFVFSCDKMTEKRRSGQMTAIATIFSEAKADEMVQTFHLAFFPLGYRSRKKTLTFARRAILVRTYLEHFFPT